MVHLVSLGCLLGNALNAGTLLGCVPNNFLAVNAGSKLKQLRSLNELYDARLMAIGEFLPLEVPSFLLGSFKADVHSFTGVEPPALRLDCFWKDIDLSPGCKGSTCH